MKHNPYKIYFVTSAVLFSMAFGFLWWCCGQWNWWSLYFLAVNFVVGSLYFWDKIIAGRGKFTRVPELVLHSLALLGGSPIALVSQKLFRHKISKKSFVVIYWLIVLVQVGLVVWFSREFLFFE
jgi:uncharacterized membrane protein YsdA (DUF1294 family)